MPLPDPDMPRPWIFRCWSLLAVSLITFVSLSSAVLVNVTVDDSLPDPVTGSRIVYSPPENWIAGAAGCTNCTAFPNPSRALDGTWHESSFFPVWEGGGPADVVPTATFSFEGMHGITLSLRFRLNDWNVHRLGVVCVLHHRSYHFLSRDEHGYGVCARWADNGDSDGRYERKFILRV